MIRVFKSIIILFLISFQIQAFGQLILDDINPELIKQKTVRKYIVNQLDENKHEFAEIQPSWTSNTDLSLYSKNEMSFLLNGNFKDIWLGYMSENPSNSWNGRKVSFGVLLQKFPNDIFYNNDPISGIKYGQVYFLNLKILMGIWNIPVAFEIVTVDTTQKVLEFSYIKGNKSSGMQQIKFLDIGEGQTKIMHVSYFKSDSHFRDKWIYPFFHKKIVRDFHRNMRHLLNLEKLKKRIIEDAEVQTS